MGINTRAEDNSVLIKPSRCIALHQGQSCYQKITVQWQLARAANVCLLVEDNAKPLQCWDNLTSGSMVWEFEGKKTVRMQLVENPGFKIIAEQVLVVAWVYDANSRRESHWRLF